MKIHVRRSALGVHLFADYYPAADARLLVVYFGGAITAHAYDERRETEPTPLLEHWNAAVSEASTQADLLVIPAPPGAMPAHSYLRRAVLTHVQWELLSAAGAPLRPLVACFGNSYGALFATALASELSACRRVVTMGGVGMSEMAEFAPPDFFSHCQFLCFTNDGDPLQPETYTFQAMAFLNGGYAKVHEGHGGHDFADYAANGFVEQGFRFLIQD